MNSWCVESLVVTMTASHSTVLEHLVEIGKGRHVDARPLLGDLRAAAS